MRLFTKITYTILICVLSVATSYGQSNAPEPIVLDGHFQRHQVTAQGSIQQLLIQNLVPGEQYNLVAAGELGTGACVPVLSLPNPLANEVVFDAAAGMLTFTAESSNITVQLEFPCTWNAATAPEHYLTLACLTCKKKTMKEVAEGTASLLEVEGGYTAEQLIKEVLVGGNCFDITNVTFSGNAGQIGKFFGGLTSIGFATGMIMATGDINVAVGPNDQDNASAGYGNSTPDADLQQMANGGSTFDLANIEFDFTPTQTPLTFEYVFGSEEYCEYVNSQFNDAFGFFVSGPGISGPFSGAANIAVLPGGGTYVTINNVNHLTNTGYFTNNTGPTGQLCGQTPSFLPGVNEVQFDGYTKKMIAVAPVIPCETYHVKLKIADVGDGIFDSGVFLKSGSFDGGGNASVDFVVNGDPDIDLVYESCGTVQLIFDRVGGNLNLPLAVLYTITGSATPGADYTPIPPVVIIPAGSEQVILTINILNDNILEGSENIVITLNSPCSCLNPQEELVIEDLPQLFAAADTVTICGGGVGTVTAFPEGGVGPYTYQWSNGTTSESMTAFVGVSTNFKVTITDDCGKTSVATARIIVTPPPTAQLLPPAPQICPGGTATINVNFTGTGPYELNYTVNGDQQTPIYNITSDPYQLVVDEPGLYLITNVVDSLGCVGAGQGALLITVSTINLTGVATNQSCSGSNNGAINTTITGGQGPYNYSWQGPINIGNIPDPVNLPSGVYNVTVTDGFGCTDDLNFNLQPPNPIIPAVLGTTIADCNNPTGGSIDLNVTGGNPNYTYLWNNGQTVQDPLNLGAGNYTVTVTDLNNCSSTLTATVPGNFILPNAVANAPGPIDCLNPAIVLDGTGSSTGSNFSYNWTASPGNILSGNGTLNPTVNQSGNYIIAVTDANNGCIKYDTVSVLADQNLPTASAGPNQTITCLLSTPTLNGSASSQGNNFNYVWTATQGGVIVSGDSTLNPVVSNTGLYILTVTNTTNGCIKVDTAQVDQNTTAPNAVAANPPVLTCTSSSVTLNGNGSTPNGQLNFDWNTANGTIQSGEFTPDPVVTSAGDYTLVVTNTQNGCVDSVTVTVVPDQSVPLVTAAYSDVITCATPQSILDGAGSSTGANYTYLWSSSNGQILTDPTALQITAGAPGTYTLVVTNASNNCTATFNIDVPSDLAPPVANAGTQQILSCTNPTLSLDGSNSSSGPEFSYSWTASNGGNIVTGPNTINPAVDAAGTYTLVVLDNSNGCSSSSSVDVLNDAADPVIQIANPATLDCNDLQIAIDANGTSTGNNMSYVWTGPNILSGANSLNPVVGQPGPYTLLVTNSDNGCTTEQTVNVGQDIASPPADAGPDKILNCNFPQLPIGGPGNPTGAQYSFTWAGAGIVSGGNTPTPQINLGGNYNLTVTNNNNGCTSTDVVTINVDFTPPLANAGPTFELTCLQNTFTLQSSGSIGPNFTYLWTTQTGGFATPTNVLQPTVNAPGDYNLLVTNNTNGCTSTASVTITQSADIPDVEAGTAGVLTCNVLNLQLNGAGSETGPNITYQWTAGPGGSITAGGNTLTPTVNAPGLYTLLVFDNNNSCFDTDTVHVTQNIVPPPVDAGAVATLTCTQPVLNLQGAVNAPGNYTYLWQAQSGGNITSGNTTLTPTVDAAGVYVLTVTNQQTGCVNTDQVQINVDQVPPVAAIANPAILTCALLQTTLDASASSTGNMGYSWTTSNGHIVNTNNPLAPLIDDPGTYSLIVTDQDNGCTSGISIVVAENVQAPVASAGTDGLLTCAVTTQQLNGNGSSQNGNFVYLWTGPGPITGANTLTPSVTQGGNYTLQVTNQDNGCTSTDNVQVNVNTTAPAVAIANPATLTCLQTSVPLNGNGSQVGPGITYLWSTSNGNIVNNPTTLQPVVNMPGVYQLLVTNGNNGCTSTATTTVPQNVVLPSAEAGPGFLLTCTVDEVNLEANGSTGPDYIYSWSTQGGQIVAGANTLNPLVNHQGVYTLTVTNQTTGCTQTDNVQIDQETNLPTDLVAQLDPPTCHDNDGIITFATITGGVGPYQYSIDGGNNYYSAADFQNISPGIYTLWIKDSNGCEYQEQLGVPKAPDPAVDILPEIQLTLGDSASLEAHLPLGYPLALVDTIIWTPITGLDFEDYSILNLLTPGAKPFRTTEYTVTVISGEGCTAEDRIIVRVDDEPHIFVPNAFSPWQNDGDNNIVLIFAKDTHVKNIKIFQIYDRWGELMFEDANFLPNDRNHGWNGTYRGKLMDPAVFVYLAEVELIDGRVILLKGDITLVK